MLGIHFYEHLDDGMVYKAIFQPRILQFYIQLNAMKFQSFTCSVWLFIVFSFAYIKADELDDAIALANNQIVIADNESNQLQMFYLQTQLLM